MVTMQSRAPRVDLSTMVFSVDFDGTIVKHAYPEIGAPVPLALATLRALQSQGAKIILWTMRSGPELEEAVAYCKKGGIELYGVNVNPSQSTWTQSPKPYAHVYIDDAAFGCPLLRELADERAWVDWNAVGVAYGL